ncbi:Ig domain-containing protein, partial [Ohtaekwangia sp.]|uniref:Ig domain-containing protein n=1 Tax=Ohtaekwangia sp. TaxID=2066019 RepID=UPI002FDE71FE
MKKSLCTYIVLGLWILMRLPALAQPGDPDCTVVYDSILPTHFATGYEVGEGFYEPLTAVDDNGIHHDDALFNLEYGDFPPGLSLEGNILSGIFTTVGNYTFAIGVNGGPECPTLVREYTLAVTNAVSCDDFHIAVIYGESGHHNVGEEEYYGICSTGIENAQTYNVLHLPRGYSIQNYTPGNACIEVWGSALETGPQSIIIEGISPTGCRDTLILTNDYHCATIERIAPFIPALPPSLINQYYSQRFYIEYTPFSLGLPFHFKISAGELPPGLTLLDSGYMDAHLRGIPTTPGEYTFTLQAILGDSCVTVEQVYTLLIEETHDCSGFSIGIVYAENTYGYVGIPEFYDICNTADAEPVQFEPAGLLPGYTLTANSPGCTTLAGTVTEAGTFSMKIVGKTPLGCVDTLIIANTWTCIDGGGFDPQELPSYTVGQPVRKGFLSSTHTQFGVPMTYEVTSGTLPPGLTLDADSVGYTDYDVYLSGQPTTPGTYTFTIRGYLGTNCAGSSQTYTVQIVNPAAPRSLVLTPLCADSIAVR